MIIINLTQHAASAEQVAAGVVDLTAGDRALLAGWLSFDECPAAGDIGWRAECIADLADPGEAPEHPHAAMIGGAPWLMGPLASALRSKGIAPVFAFSARESVDVALSDGCIRKTAVFRHRGWVDA